MSCLDRWMRFKLRKAYRDVDRAIRYVVRSAYRNVPFYKKTWDAAGTDPEGVRGQKYLDRLPATLRRVLAGVPERERRHQGAETDRCFRTSTSGYLGIPLTIYMGRTEALWRRLTFFQALCRYGKLPFPLRLADVGPMVPAHRAGTEQKFKLVQLLRLPATLPPEEMARHLWAFRPHVVEGYPTCLAILAEEMVRSGRSTPKPRLVVSRGELLHDSTRELLRCVFSSPVADLYNCEEGGNMAWECPKHPGLWHVNQDTCALEVVDADGVPVPPGAVGRVLLTSLFNHTMPFIRYELGDRATAGPVDRCTCGVQGPSLTSIEGRDDDFLIAPDGRRLSPRLVANTVLNSLREASDPSTVTRGVRQFQIVQLGPDELVLRVVLANPDRPEEADRAARALERAFQGTTCRVEQVSKLPRAPGGKLKKVIAARTD